MVETPPSSAVFAGLAGIFAPYRSRLIAKRDEPGDLSLETPPSSRYPKGLYFGAVRIGKRYVSFHLMPVYTNPELLDGISPALRKRMQGKSCFNFTKPDEALFAELRELTAAGFRRFAEDGLIPGG
jgi:hypothetical protein